MGNANSGGRIKTTLGGLALTAFSLVFVVAGIAMVVTSARQAATYRPVAATVDKVTGTEPGADEVAVSYSFTVEGKRYTGKDSADDEQKARFHELRQHQVGQRITVYYDPSDPTRSVRSVKADAAGLAFSIFALPFLALALNHLWLGLTGREFVRSRRMNAQSDPIPGGSLFLIFSAACVAGTFAQLGLCSVLAWPWSLASGLGIVFIAIPAVTLGASRLVRRWRSAKSLKLRQFHAEQLAAREAGAAGDGDAEPADDVDARSYLAGLDSLGKKLAIALAFTIFWCGITGLFGYFAIGSLFQHHYARLRFATTDGVILSSKVKVFSGSEDGDTYAPKIKYRYTVAGREYVGERYDFVGGSSSDGSYAQRAVGENPAGKHVTVYYDPADPARAILHTEVPAIAYFLLLFLQPFFLVGLGMISWCATLPWADRRLRRFFHSDASPPWRIPGWGVMEKDFEGLVLRSRPNPLEPLGYFLAGYGLACFASIFVIAFFFHGFGDANPAAVRWAFLVSAGAGVAALGWRLFSAGGTGRLVIDVVRGRLAVHTRRRDLDTSLEEITGLRLREIAYPDDLRVNGQRTRYLLLEATCDDKPPMPLHAFGWHAGKEAETQAVAKRTRDLLAGLIGCPAIRVVAKDDPEPSEPPTNAADALGRLPGLFARLRSDSLSDLT